MDVKKHITALGFIPKNGTSGIYHKVYSGHDNYVISIDFDKEHIEYGDKIIAESKTTQNFSQPENFVVLECVDRLLIQGYKPQNIILEKTWPSGHGTSGRLDICVNREDGAPYMLIECKTYGKEYNKESARIHKDGGCSKDVLVLRSADTNKYLPKYIFYMLRRDVFFDYVMEGKKGIKMPRGNKEDILKYRIPIPSSIDEQMRIVSQIEALESEITKARNLIENTASEKQTILDKYL